MYRSEHSPPWARMRRGRVAKQTKDTRLERMIDALDVRPTHVVQEAERLAREHQRRAISRQQFLRIRYGQASATEDKIFIIVAAMRAVTGLLLEPSDLFDLEPGAEAMSFGSLAFSGSRSRGRLDGSHVNVPVVCDGLITGRLFVSQDSGSTDDARVAIRRVRVAPPCDRRSSLPHPRR